MGHERGFLREAKTLEIIGGIFDWISLLGRRLLKTALVGSIAALVASACSEGTAPSPRNDESDTPGIVVRAKPADGDTVAHEPEQALWLRVVLDPAVQPRGQVVQLAALRATERRFNRLQVPTVFVDSLLGNSWSEHITLTTDRAGEVKARLKMGTVSGNGGLVVTVPAFGLEDTVSMDIAPGAGVGLFMQPADTAIGIGASYRLDAHVRDRFSNPRDDRVTLQGADGVEIGVDSVRGTAASRVQITGTAGAHQAVANVSVVPLYTLAAFRARANTGDTAGIAVFDTDGSDFRYLTFEVGGGFWKRDLTWVPNDDRIVYHGEGHDPFLFTVTLGGTKTQLPIEEPLPGGHYSPDASADGAWIYFAGQPTHQDLAIYRVPSDGGAAERVGPSVTWVDVDAAPAISPDGTVVAFHTNRVDFYHPHIRTFEVATGVVSAIDTLGTHPRWSPDGSQIAFLRDGDIHLMTASGTYLRHITVGNDYSRLDWSPDGEWFVAYGTAGLELVRESDGLQLRLPFGQMLQAPRFKR